MTTVCKYCCHVFEQKIVHKSSKYLVSRLTQEHYKRYRAMCLITRTKQRFVLWRPLQQLTNSINNMQIRWLILKMSGFSITNHVNEMKWDQLLKQINLMTKSSEIVLNNVENISLIRERINFYYRNSVIYCLFGMFIKNT